MNLERLKQDLREDEGVVYSIYKDHLGNATLGIGHLITREDEEWDKPSGTPVSKARVEALFDQDIEKAIETARGVVPNFDELPHVAQEVLVNMAFNLGWRRLSGFKKMIAALKIQDFKTAAAEGRDSLWRRQVPNRAEKLMSVFDSLA